MKVLISTNRWHTTLSLMVLILDPSHGAGKVLVLVSLAMHTLLWSMFTLQSVYKEHLCPSRCWSPACYPDVP